MIRPLCRPAGNPSPDSKRYTRLLDLVANTCSVGRNALYGTVLAAMTIEAK